MRTGDLAPPPVAAHVIPPGAPLDAWANTLTIAIQKTAGTVPAWDDGGLWDDGDVWDQPATDAVWTDAVCDFVAMVIDAGRPDELGLFPAVELTLALDNASGVWSTWTTGGRLAAYPIGTPICVWSTTAAGRVDWLFSGYTAEWLQAGQAVEVVAFDTFSDLALDHGVTWTPGAAGQRPKPRLTAIAAAAGWTGTLAGDTGHTDLLAATLSPDVSALEAMQQVALSDGGIVAGDVDGRVWFRDRYWRTGRADQPVIPTFTDNACDAGAYVVWDPVTGASDTAYANEVALTNIADVPVVVSTGARRPIRLTHPDPDLWPDATVGQTLAVWLLQQAIDAGWRLEQFALHLTDPNQPGLWDVAPTLRRGDRIRWVSDQPTPAGLYRLDFVALVAGFRHELTPADWTTTVYGTRAVVARTGLLWDNGAVWDDPNPDNVWS